MTTVLIVDDEASLVNNLASYLRTLGGRFDVLTAASAEEALSVLGSSPVDLLLTDVQLPGMDGIELLRRSYDYHPQLKALVMTAFGSPDLRDAALAEGAVRFIEKPLDLDELGLALERAAQPTAGWTGLMGGLDLFDLTQLLMFSGNSRVIRILYRRQQGTMRVQGGALVHASTGRLAGEEAFYQMYGWPGASFELAECPPADAPQPNLSISFGQLAIETARLTDELSRRSALVPGRTLPLRRTAGELRGDDPLNGGSSLIAAAVAERPGINLGELEDSLALARVKVELGLAWLREQGVLSVEQPADASVPADAVSERETGTWWRTLSDRHPSGVRVLIACPPEQIVAGATAAVTELAGALDAAAPRLSPTPEGPTIVRLNPGQGGRLTVTFLPFGRKHSFLFETFAKTSQLVLLHAAAGRHDASGWRQLVPAKVPCLETEDGRSVARSLSAGLEATITTTK